MIEHKSSTQRIVFCPDCNALMNLRQTNKFRYKDGSPRKFFGCSNWPKCKGTHGADPNGNPLGIPANSQTKQARMDAHRVFDQLWKTNTVSRAHSYVILQKLMNLSEKDAHIAMFTEEQCRKLISMVKKKFPDLPCNHEWKACATFKNGILQDQKEYCCHCNRKR